MFRRFRKSSPGLAGGSFQTEAPLAPEVSIDDDGDGTGSVVELGRFGNRMWYEALAPRWRDTLRKLEHRMFYCERCGEFVSELRNTGRWGCQARFEVFIGTEMMLAFAVRADHQNPEDFPIIDSQNNVRVYPSTCLKFMPNGVQPLPIAVLPTPSLVEDSEQRRHHEASRDRAVIMETTGILRYDATTEKRVTALVRTYHNYRNPDEFGRVLRERFTIHPPSTLTTHQRAESAPLLVPKKETPLT